ncbi:MAG: hypothetical protein E7K13_08450, partial [Klebsiella grimontii]|nr:hypothetical protein [Klebsiella grimontii]
LHARRPMRPGRIQVIASFAVFLVVGFMGHKPPLLTAVLAEQAPAATNTDHEIGMRHDAGEIALTAGEAFQGG